MASISNDRKTGTRRIQFVAPDGSRPAIRLGKISQRSAESYCSRVEQLLECLILKRPMDPDLARWVADLEPVIATKFAKVGLFPEPQAKPDSTMAGFIDQYIVGRTDVKPLTLRHLKDARKSLVEFFGEDRLLKDVTPGDADDYRRRLLEKLHDNTVRRRCGRAKQFFRAALRKRLITHNPFEDMKGTSVRANKTRDHFVTRETAYAVLEACPDPEWRLVFALARFGGLRVPSEILALKWSDIDWEHNRFTVRSSKTEHHEGGGIRVVPLFAELRPYLDAMWDRAESADFVINRYRGTNSNFSTQLKRYLTAAGIKPWPKLFQNLRASRATELAAEYPVHVAAEWMGHSAMVAQKHYWRVTEADYQKATGAAQKAAQQQRVGSSGESQSTMSRNEKTLRSSGFATSGDIVHNRSVPPVGLEPTTR